MPLHPDRIILRAKSEIDERLNFEPDPPQWVEYPELGVRLKLFERDAEGNMSFPLAEALKSTSVIEKWVEMVGVEIVAFPPVPEGAD